MTINCPVCNEEKEVSQGKFICSKCRSILEYNLGGQVLLIKRKKFDYITFFGSFIFPIGLIVLFFSNTARNNFYIDNELFSGLVMIFYPIIISLRQLFHYDEKNFFFLSLYLSFFKKQLNKEDTGRIIAFYITFITNLIGVALIILSIVK
jgi:predicted nucleic acid-binding Zn ribbon protein